MRDTPDLNDKESTLPQRARLVLHRCNLPPEILGGLTFQRFPTPLEIDGVMTFHADLFAQLQSLDEAEDRAEKFHD